MGPVDHSGHSSTISLIAATTAVVCFLLLAPVFLDMYLRSDKIITQAEKQEAKINKLEKQVKELQKDDDE